LQKGAYDAENVLKLMFILSAFIPNGYTSTLAYFICILAILRQLKRPRWEKDYGQKFFSSEFTHNMFYLFVFYFFPGYVHFLYYFPLVIHFWIGIAEYLNLRQGALLRGKSHITSLVAQKYVDATRAQKEKLMDMKNKIEIYLMPFSLVLIFFGMSTPFLVFALSNYLRIKYYLNAVKSHL
jgi:Transmembrane protein 33/Nucleoporin POM33